MRFQVQPLKKFLVKPAIPDNLPRLMDLAYNVLWSWDHTVRALFRRLDPALWQASGHNPILMLSQVPRSVLDRAAADPRYLTLYRHACDSLDAYMERRAALRKDGLIAYFCMEYGVVQCMQIYSGGLGLLAGDHLKAASDIGLNLTAVGLLYQQGYFRQALNPDGWQQERYPVNDFYTLPIRQVRDQNNKEIRVSVDMPHGPIQVRVWQLLVGGVSLYLLDTNLSENPEEYRDITDQLYGGDMHKRIRQEIVLGIGGLRALAAIGINPTVYHMNEGHSAFLAIERIRLLMKDHGLTFAQALEAARSNNVFTTHTSVPAGFDLFDPGLVYEYFNRYCADAGIPFDTLLSMGRQRADDSSERFSMAISALRSSSYRNAVSRLHRDVSQEMFQDMWPRVPTWEVPITSVTNGVHLPSWVSGDLAALYDQYLQPDWLERHNDPKTWEQIEEVPDAELWEVRRRRKRRLVQFVRERVAQAANQRKASAAEIRRLSEVLDPEAFTIGFSRRFATYKRATLLFRDVNRLKRILNHPDMPVQIIIAGKAHPKDHPGKSFIREIYNLSRDPELSRRLVFVEDYSIEVGRELVQGVDIWLNNPRRGEEACGTSGMKAAMNGVPNVSILDGWFDEAFEYSGGWAIGDRIPYAEDQDESHASAIYSLLENDIVPLYYKDRDRGVPEQWMRRVKQSLTTISPQFNCSRMLTEYYNHLYFPAHQGWQAASRDNYRSVREHAEWSARVAAAWDRVRFVETGSIPSKPVLAADQLPLEVVIDLAGLDPSDVRVEAVLGKVSAEGQLDDTTVIAMNSAEPTGQGFHRFSSRFVAEQTGRLGLAIRVSPNHSDDPLTRPCHSPMKWA
ncbi:MAG: alpha-glucan family phosphorylase [Bryobacteraceae bacterium]